MLLKTIAIMAFSSFLLGASSFSYGSSQGADLSPGPSQRVRAHSLDEIPSWPPSPRSPKSKGRAGTPTSPMSPLSGLDSPRVGPVTLPPYLRVKNPSAKSSARGNGGGGETRPDTMSLYEILTTPWTSEHGERFKARLIALQTTLAPDGYESEVNVKERDTGKTLLTCAVEQQSLPIIKLLLISGANPNEVDDKGMNPLHYACQLGFVEIAKHLLRNNDNQSKYRLDLTGAVRKPWRLFYNRRWEQYNVFALIDPVDGSTKVSWTEPFFSRVDVNSVDIEGRTPLMHACFNGSYETVEILLDSGAKFHLRSPDHGTAEELARRFGHARIADYLQGLLRELQGALAGGIQPGPIVAVSSSSSTTGDGGSAPKKRSRGASQE